MLVLVTDGDNTAGNVEPKDATNCALRTRACGSTPC